MGFSIRQLNNPNKTKSFLIGWDKFFGGHLGLFNSGNQTLLNESNVKKWRNASFFYPNFFFNIKKSENVSN